MRICFHSLCRLHLELQRRLGRQLSAPKFLYAVEWDSEAQQELLLLMEDSHDSCIFQAMASFYRPELQSIVTQLKSKPASCHKFRLCFWLASHSVWFTCGLIAHVLWCVCVMVFFGSIVLFYSVAELGVNIMLRFCWEGNGGWNISAVNCGRQGYQ